MARPTAAWRGRRPSRVKRPLQGHDHERLSQSQVTTRARPLLPPCSLVLPGDPGLPPEPPLDPALGIALATHGAAACGECSFRARLRDPRKQGTDLGLPVAAVAAESPDGRQLSGLCPARDRLGVHAEHRRDLSRRQQRLSLGRACRHMYGLSSWTGRYYDPAFLSLAPRGARRGCPIWPTQTILPSPAVTSRPPGAKIL